MPKEGDPTAGFDAKGGLEQTPGLPKKNYRPGWSLACQLQSVAGIREAYFNLPTAWHWACELKLTFNSCSAKPDNRLLREMPRVERPKKGFRSSPGLFEPRLTLIQSKWLWLRAS
jgi:hypothetical protein